MACSESARSGDFERGEIHNDRTAPACPLPGGGAMAQGVRLHRRRIAAGWAAGAMGADQTHEWRLSADPAESFLHAGGGRAVVEPDHGLWGHLLLRPGRAVRSWRLDVGSTCPQPGME